MRRKGKLRLDMSTLPLDIASVIEAAVEGQSVTIARSGRVIGTLEFSSSVFDGIVEPTRADDPPITKPPGDVIVVATAMDLSDAARSKLSVEFGDEYVVLDLADAPPSTDVLLVPPASPQLIAALHNEFKRARIIIAEIDDPDMGVDYSGPVARMLGAGASAYLPPRPISELPSSVRRHLTSGTTPEIESPPRSVGDLPSIG